MDTLTPAERSARMALVRAKNSRPEIIVRKLVHSLGFRFRLHARNLPGQPDIVFPRLRKIILVHGCFWHRHHCAMGDRLPRSRRKFWQEKLAGNQARDVRQIAKLRRLGWRVRVVWECQTAVRKLPQLTKRLERFLGL